MSNENSPSRRDAAGRFLKGNAIGSQSRFQGGVSGNPAGSSALRRAFEARFFEALIDPALAEEALAALREGVKKREQWALNWYLSRIAPPQLDLRMVSQEAEAVNWSALSDEELDRLESIAERLSRSRALASGEMPQEPPAVHPSPEAGL